MDISVLAIALLLPFLGTSLGAALVFVLRNQLAPKLQKILIGFAAGVMVSAAFWGLLLPSVEESADMGGFAFMPAVIGFLLGMGFLLLLDTLTPHMHADKQEEGLPSKISKSAKLVLAITIHNIPEGMAVGVVLADCLTGGSVGFAAALALAIGIAIQNFPEGAIVSTPLLAQGISKPKTFGLGVLTGAVESVAAIITILAAETVVPAMPYLLAFAAGAMIYVVVEELIPEMSEGKHSNIGTVAFALGFALMMVLDVVLG